jgi:FtsH-binding integral membrane protein
MDSNIFNPNLPIVGAEGIASTRSFLSRVFTYMALALVVSGSIAWWFANDQTLLNMLRDEVTRRPTGVGWIVMLAPIGLVLLMTSMMQRMSVAALLATFVVYSAMTGMSLSFIFLAYTSSSIASTFFMSAVVFGIMAITGYTTRTDLTKFGSIMMIGLVGIVIASLVNLVIGSTLMSTIVSVIGVLVFTGLTAYDMQKLKVMSTQVGEGTEIAQKMSLMGALTLYLDFLNLFLMLLRLFGNRRN